VRLQFETEGTRVEAPGSSVSLGWARHAWGQLQGPTLVQAALTGPIADIDRRTPVVFLETGKLFPETLAYRDELVSWLRLEDVRSVRPDPGDLARLDGEGDLWRREPNLCCHIRKTEPLDLALSGFVGWISGRKRFHGGVRTSVPTIESGPSTAGRLVHPA
jgi:phosphoadenosine phosphosulfate reductase